LCFLPRVGLGLQSFYIYLYRIWHYRCVLSQPACLLRWGLATFLLGLASNHDAPNFYLVSSWIIYKHWWNTSIIQPHHRHTSTHRHITAYPQTHTTHSHRYTRHR
jgi:hypothetical protein